MDIIFTDLHNYGIEPPVPAKNLIPEWYKNQISYLHNEKVINKVGDTPATVKKCIPVFDAITAGYIISTPADLQVQDVNGEHYYTWGAFDLISFHPQSQASEHPLRLEGRAYPKFNNPWSIKTPKGYSILITAPMHRESPFKILDGIVDSDVYTNPVNFPFQLKDEKFEGIIPKGTPVAQIIPFKRESWEMKLGTDEDRKEAMKVRQNIVTEFFDKYKKRYWTRKEYK